MMTSIFSADLSTLTQQQLLERLRATEREVEVMRQELSSLKGNATTNTTNRGEGSVERVGTDSELFPSNNNNNNNNTSNSNDNDANVSTNSIENDNTNTDGSRPRRSSTTTLQHLMKQHSHSHSNSNSNTNTNNNSNNTASARPVTPAQQQQEVLVRKHKEPYQVSFGVLVIDGDGKNTSNVPLTTVINKSYLRPDEREADTPVAQREHGTQHANMSNYYDNSRAFSAEMMARMGSMDGTFGMNHSLALSLGGGDHSPNASGLSLGGGVPSSGGEQRQDSISAELLHADMEGSPMFSGQRQMMEDGSAQRGAGAGAGAGAGLGLQLRPFALDPHRLSRLGSVGPDALLTNNTLNVFKRTFGATNTDAVTPVCSSAMTVYRYLNAFAERGFVHEDEGAKEGLGRMLQQLCKEVDVILRSEPRHAAVESPAFVFGDIHGNFRDLHYFMKNLVHFGDLRYTPHRFMFLGDYVDRGEFSVEVVAYLFAMKVLAPEKVALLRGNHEDTLVSGDLGNYGSTSFRAQCRQLFGTILGEDVWNKASNAFASLPLTGNIDGKIFCTHGGLPRFCGGPDTRLAELSRDDFPRFLSFFQIPEDETAEQQRLRQMGTDTCWADPADDERMLDGYGFGANPRGQGVILFGSEAVDHFLNTYGYEMIFRAHQEKSDGLKLSKNARVFTIFSTSAYVGHSNGAGVVMVADGKVRLIIKTAENEEEEDY